MHPPGLPLTLSRLHSARDTAERDVAWAEFIAMHSDVVLHACRSLIRDHDAAMDSYAFALEALRENGCRRLCAYVPDGKTKFSTWLLVVTRRLVLDYYRHRYGRARSDDDARRAEHRTRRRLEDLVAAEIDPEEIEDKWGDIPDAAIRGEELQRALRRSLEELDPADRLLLALRFADQRPVREIATALGLPSVFHVYRRLSSVLLKLRSSLKNRGVEEPEP